MVPISTTLKRINRKRHRGNENEEGEEIRTDLRLAQVFPPFQLTPDVTRRGDRVRSMVNGVTIR